jgi:hypothetical protein
MQYFQIDENGDLPTIGHFAPFKAVVAIEAEVSDARRAEVCRWLVGAGVRYVMLCGVDCETWSSPIRQANLDQVDLQDMQPEQFVMITIHGREKLRGVFWHAKKHAHHTHVEIDNILTIHIGSQNRSLEYSTIFDKA